MKCLQYFIQIEYFFSANDALVLPMHPLFDAASMEPVHAVDVGHVIAPLVELLHADGTLFHQIFARCLHFVLRELFLLGFLLKGLAENAPDFLLQG